MSAPIDPKDAVVTEDALTVLLRRYADCEISAANVVRALGPEVSTAEVVLETRCRIGRLPDPSGPFVEGECRRGLALPRRLGIIPAGRGPDGLPDEAVESTMPGRDGASGDHP